ERRPARHKPQPQESRLTPRSLRSANEPEAPGSSAAPRLCVTLQFSALSVPLLRVLRVLRVSQRAVLRVLPLPDGHGFLLRLLGVRAAALLLGRLAEVPGEAERRLAHRKAGAADLRVRLVTRLEAVAEDAERVVHVQVHVGLVAPELAAQAERAEEQAGDAALDDLA